MGNENAAIGNSKINHQSGSEDLELTTHADSAMHKREPLQVSSEEIDDNTEME